MKTPLFALALGFAVCSPLACGESEPSSSGGSPAPPPDPQRCELRRIEDISSAAERGELPLDAYVEVEGLTDPRTLVWKDSSTGNAHFITKVMGTGRRVYYTEKLDIGESPTARSRLVGHMQRWDRLAEEKAATLSAALEREHDSTVKPSSTWLLTAGEKPAGCE
ncbi:MAG: hypothetical protein R6V85_00780 [Polyangia bacterium]